MSSKPRIFSVWIRLPRDLDHRVESWCRGVPGASRDPQGSHVTVLTCQSAAPQHLIEQRIRHACAATGPFLMRLTDARMDEFWGKEGLKIVMLADSTPDPHGVYELRTTIIRALIDIDLELLEADPFVPHVTLTSGASTPDAIRLLEAAAVLSFEFRVDVVQLSMTAREIGLKLGRLGA